MIGLDSNILLRHVVQDDVIQSRKASDFIERQLTPGDQGFVSMVAMAELAWVLERTYGLPDVEIAAAVEIFLHTESIVVESEKEVFVAMTALKEGRGSFADALIAAIGDRTGCKHTVTFDRKALRLPGFVAL
jgi:predicted nucleic-acid-binding protein